MPYATPAPSTLEDVFKMNPGAFMQGQQFMQGGVQQNDADLQKTQLQNMFDQQNNPLRLQHQGLENQTLDAQLPGVSAQSSMLQRKNTNEGAWNDEAVKAAKAKFLADASDSHIKELGDKAQEMAWSNDPDVSDQGQKLLALHADVVKEKSKQSYMADRQKELEAQRGKNQLANTQLMINAGRWSPKAVHGAQDQLEKALTSGSWDKAASAYDYMAQKAVNDGDMENAQYYQQKSQEYSNKYLQSRNAPKAGGVNAGEVTGLPVQPTPTVVPPALPGGLKGPALNAADIANGAQFNSPEVEAQVRANAARATPPAKPPVQTLSDVQKLYPGIPADKLKEAFKKKFGVDLK